MSRPTRNDSSSSSWSSSTQHEDDAPVRVRYKGGGWLDDKQTFEGRKLVFIARITKGGWSSVERVASHCRGRLSFESRADTKIEFPALALAGWKKRRGRTYAKSSSVDFHPVSLAFPPLFCLLFLLSLFLSLFVSFSRAFRAACTMSTDRPSQGFILIPFPPCPGEGIGFNFRPAGNSIRNGAL